MALSKEMTKANIACLSAPKVNAGRATQATLKIEQFSFDQIVDVFSSLKSLFTRTALSVCPGDAKRIDDAHAQNCMAFPESPPVNKNLTFRTSDSPTGTQGPSERAETLHSVEVGRLGNLFASISR